jgi:hypothetical protein
MSLAKRRLDHANLAVHLSRNVLLQQILACSEMFFISWTTANAQSLFT